MPDPSLVNATFGSWTLREMISAGGIAEVYRGEHSDDGRSVAIKVMRSEKQKDKYHLTAFQREFEFLTALKHPALPVGRRQGEIKGRACFAMDYFSGLPLHQIVATKQPFDRLAALSELVQVAAYLHREKVVHADLKLENVLLRPTGRIALVDFGNAKRSETQSFFGKLFGKKEERVFGTPTYLAPELMKGKLPSYSSDVYALGVCAFILLSGEPPFDASGRTGRLKANLNSAPPTIRSRCPELPLRVAQAIDRCLDKEPGERPADADSLWAQIKELATAGGDTTRLTRSKVRA
jgi:serine/threonine protein kinase